jgi:hypothetical protein
MMLRTTLLPLFIAFAGFAAPAAASHYVAVPVVKAGAAKVPLQGVVWQCNDAGCAAPQTNSRPETVCGAFASKMGAVRSFIVAGRAFDAAALEKCNKRARN